MFTAIFSTIIFNIILITIIIPIISIIVIITISAHAHFRKGVTEWNIQMMIQLVDGSTVKRFSSAQDTGGGKKVLAPRRLIIMIFITPGNIQFIAITGTNTTLEEPKAAGVAAACTVVTEAVSRMPGAGPPSEYISQDLDHIVLLFQRAFIGQRAASAAKQLQQLRELEAETGLPPVQEHLALLSSTSKGLLLGCLLIPEVLARDGGLADVAAVERAMGYARRWGRLQGASEGDESGGALGVKGISENTL
ncbi:hypothetical protein AK812_SmicGene37231 [Symbiodinium microadriaticum]|uniref:Uncharacterized protein n=1 Tax=Symbiodinium microadriaticum TaxID=2951 RepID=A0A1Q9CGU1_SYMMI|nr:hypothetical protein AK812_SmicGene37231 [Symbiodinium microadriaticum]